MFVHIWTRSSMMLQEAHNIILSFKSPLSFWVILTEQSWLIARKKAMLMKMFRILIDIKHSY